MSSGAVAPPFDLYVESELVRGAGPDVPGSEFCLTNFQCDLGCEFPPEPGTPDGPDVIGSSGMAYRTVQKFIDEKLPPGAYVTRCFMQVMSTCCVTSGGSVDCGDIDAPCLAGCPTMKMKSSFLVSLSIGGCAIDSVVTYDTSVTPHIWRGTASLDFIPITVLVSCEEAGLVVTVIRNDSGLSVAIHMTIRQCCPLQADGSAYTLDFPSCSIPGQMNTHTMSAFIGPLTGDGGSTDGLIILGMFAEVFYPDPPTVVEVGCDKNEDCGDCGEACPPCPDGNRLPSILFADIAAPNCPAADGKEIDITFNATEFYGLTQITNGLTALNCFTGLPMAYDYTASVRMGCPQLQEDGSYTTFIDFAINPPTLGITCYCFKRLQVNIPVDCSVPFFLEVTLDTDDGPDCDCGTTEQPACDIPGGCAGPFTLYIWGA